MHVKFTPLITFAGLVLSTRWDTARASIVRLRKFAHAQFYEQVTSFRNIKHRADLLPASGNFVILVARSSLLLHRKAWARVCLCMSTLLLAGLLDSCLETPCENLFSDYRLTRSIRLTSPPHPLRFLVMHDVLYEWALGANAACFEGIFVFRNCVESFWWLSVV